jgi:chaperonin cofactor prefoldin
MDNVREKIKTIKMLLEDNDLNLAREELTDEVDQLEAIIDYLENKNNSLRERMKKLLEDTIQDLDEDFEEIGDILY